MNRKKQMVEESLTRIMQIREMIDSFGLVKSFLMRRGDERDINCGNIYEKLYERELDEWRGLFMWGLITDEPTRDRIKAAAYERFLSEKKGVHQWMFNGENPSKWLASTEDEFREFLKEEFINKQTKENT
jgi:hypothetical protein